jgi:hypothetical protein
MIATSNLKSAGCGCGGSATMTVSPCSCGGTGCASCLGQGIVRPRFFAGQLLTEDDLQLLTDYVAQKNRLHNRYLFGEGVVCGLEVTCHPCGDGQVIVHPGYALDCCGNDLTLSCAQTLDINAMIRDLRRDKLGGFDCVDPCPDPPRTEAESKEKKDSALETSDDKNNDKEQKPSPYKYCLYIRYCEQETEPVMPYSTGDDCGRLACEPTRLREGVKFELRCRPLHDAGHPLIARLCACLGDLNRLQRIIELVRLTKRNTNTLSFTLESDVAVFAEADIPVLTQKNAALTSILQKIPSATGAAPPATGVPPSVAPPSVAPPSVEATAEGKDDAAGRIGGPVLGEVAPDPSFAVREVAVLVNRFDALPTATQSDFLKKENFTTVLSEARLGIERVRALVVVETTNPFNEVRDWLIERLNNVAFPVDCTLRQRVFAMTLPRFTAPIGARGAQTQVAIYRPLVEAFLEYLRYCVCGAFNPVCAPCDDPAVLLACLEVADCDVLRICNMERSFVVSPAATRYWLPPLQLIGNLVERLCCDTFDSLLTAAPEGKRFDFGELLKREVLRMLEDSLCGGLELFERPASNITRTVQSASARVARAFESVSAESKPASLTVPAPKTTSAKTTRRVTRKQTPKPKPKQKAKPEPPPPAVEAAPPQEVKSE